MSSTTSNPKSMTSVAAVLQDGICVVSTASVQESRLRVSGYAVHPNDQPDSLRIRANGVLMEFERYQPHKAQQSALRVDEVHHFEAIGKDIPGGLIEIRAVFGSRPSAPPVTYYFQPEAHVLPDSSRRVRVHGTEEESSFNLIGCTIAHNIRALAEQYNDKPLSSIGRVLDWGCGCGRVARFLFPELQEPVGVDIDVNNIQWCRESLPGSFLATSLDPPLPFPENTFDLIFGISVMTHLGESDQEAWLRELLRISRSGGLILLSVHGYRSAFLNGAPPELYDTLDRNGFLDAGRDGALDGHTSDPGRYRGIYQTPDYIRNRWAKYFLVLDVLPGFLASNQDLVVLRKNS